MTSLNIGEAASAAGITPKMVRHYESIGLVSAIGRTDSGYRQYSPRDVHVLRFIRHSRDLGFSLDQIRELLSLWQDRLRPSRQVKALAQAHIDELEKKLRELQAMRSTLQTLVGCCHGDERPDCPIIESLAGDEREAAKGGTMPGRLGRLIPRA
ncbi:Cu(I)-responsive transcriptional regulator [Rhizobacter sp. LjRoot28]|uniref:Cu(I)-responsive transcriptional regulator n=1 Tax=Rhizobacter sp. LjRoot28 TaxID=3342309 RepID=UPI003ECD255E